MMAMPIPTPFVECQVEVEGGICGAPLEIAEHIENLTFFSLAKQVETMPDGRTLVVASQHYDNASPVHTSSAERWIRCRLGHRIRDLAPDTVVKWT